RYGGNFLAAFLLFLLSSDALARLDVAFPKMDAHGADVALPPPDDRARDWNAEGERLRLATLSHGWHLQSGLSLERLARHFGMNQAYVSRSLNQGLGQTFSQFVNALRVEHAKGLLGDPQLSVLDIALRSGFGSKASFNRAFREHAGATPSQVRKALRTRSTTPPPDVSSKDARE
ncbi:MAG: AraC family transcriptional regulator, partial [Pseudomonadota bacterium]